MRLRRSESPDRGEEFIGMPFATLQADGVPAHGHENAHFMYVVSGSYRTRAAGTPASVCMPPQCPVQP
jgi:hypothetical protein